MLASAAEKGIRLGIENRDGYEQMPSEREFPELLDKPGRPAVLADFGHAQRKENMVSSITASGSKKMGSRAIGAHLHDCRWPVEDHCVPFTGDIDYASSSRFSRRTSLRHRTPPQARSRANHRRRRTLAEGIRRINSVESPKSNVKVLHFSRPSTLDLGLWTLDPNETLSHHRAPARHHHPPALVDLPRSRQARANGRRLRTANLWWFLPGLAAFGLVLVIQTQRWQILLRAIGIHLRWLRAWQLVMIGMFFNLFLLGATGGDVIKIFYAMREAKGGKGGPRFSASSSTACSACSRSRSSPSASSRGSSRRS